MKLADLPLRTEDTEGWKKLRRLLDAWPGTDKSLTLQEIPPFGDVLMVIRFETEVGRRELCFRFGGYDDDEVWRTVEFRARVERYAAEEVRGMRSRDFAAVAPTNSRL